MAIHNSSRNLIFFVLALSWATLPATLFSADWVQWRGPQRNGVSLEKQWTSEKLKGTPKIIWTRKVGRGYSAITVKNDYAWTLGNTGKQDTIYCLNAKTGKQIWQYSYPCPGGSYPGPRATPTIQDHFLYSCSRNGQVFCLNAKTGKVHWQRNLMQELQVPNISWGFSSSPLVWRGTIFLNAGKNGIALSARTGKTRWFSGKGKAGYASPVIFRRKPAQLLIFGQQALCGVAAKTGALQWSFPWKTSYDVNAADPLVAGDLIFISSGYGKGCTLLEVKKNQVRQLWQNKKMRNHFSTSLLMDHYIYGIDGNAGRGVLRCLDLHSGQEKWSQASIGFGSLLAADGKLIILNERGRVFIAAASPDSYRELASSQVMPPGSGKCWTMPSLAHGRLYLRSSKGVVVCLDLRSTQK